jgi:AraC family transcriptional regulator
MPSITEAAVERAISCMYQNLSDQLTIDDMARAAMFSKFHFTRVFQRVTGTSPGRFLSAIRLQEAKRLLTSTTMNVADISLQVGYSSVGTFSTRFAKSVGLSPTAYRRQRGYVARIPSAGGSALTGGIAGRIHCTDGAPVPDFVFIGLFPGPIPEGRPLRCAILEGSRSYRFADVPPGVGHLFAHGVAGDPFQPSRAGLTVASSGAVAVHSRHTAAVDLELRRPRSIDPPVLVALQDTRRAAFQRREAESLAA